MVNDLCGLNIKTNPEHVVIANHENSEDESTCFLDSKMVESTIIKKDAQKKIRFFNTNLDLEF